MDENTEQMLAPRSLAVVATPLGHLGDISSRAAQILSQVDVVLAEDTRRSRVLLSHLQIKKKLVALHAHNEFRAADAWLDKLASGARLALITDAGTPAISDPGAHLVAGAHARGLPVVPIPGPSALATALSAAGFMLDDAGAWFLGFLSRQAKVRQLQVDQMTAHRGAVIFFEAPLRLKETLLMLAERMPERQVCLCRELTKRHEQILRNSLAELASQLAAPIKGECTVVLGPLGDAADETGDGEATKAREVARALFAEGLSARDVASALKVCLELPRGQAYACAQDAKKT